MDGHIVIEGAMGTAEAGLDDGLIRLVSSYHTLLKAADVRRYCAALLKLAAEVDGEDWRVVPAEPTDEMRWRGRDIGNLSHHLNAFHDDDGNPDAELLDGASRAIYRAMLSKAPAPEGDGA